MSRRGYNTRVGDRPALALCDTVLDWSCGLTAEQWLAVQTAAGLSAHRMRDTLTGIYWLYRNSTGEEVRPPSEITIRAWIAHFREGKNNVG